MIAVILAGGKGTRLAEIAKDVPKPLVSIHGKPILQYQIENLKRSGIDRVILVVGYQGHKIKAFFGNGAALGVSIDYYHEESPLGTAGAFYYLKERLPEDFLVIYGDLVFDVDFIKFIAFHKKNNALCSLMVHPNDHPHDSDIIVQNNLGIVQSILKKNTPREGYYSNNVNAGIILLNKQGLNSCEQAKKQDLEVDLILPLLASQRVFGYKTSEYIRDMGTPERFKKVQEHLFQGVVHKRSMVNKQKDRKSVV